MPDLFAFQNYRVYLEEYYNEQKKLKRNFSYRAFSKKAGINASAFLFYVIKGQRNLTKSSIQQVAKALDLIPGETEYFENLVYFNQAKSISEKANYYSRIIKSRKPRLIEKLNQNKYEYFSKWYHCVIRELVTIIDFKRDFQLLGICTLPPITAKEAKESVELLEKLDFIKQDKQGQYHIVNPVISARSEGAEVFAIEKFQQEMLELARFSFTHFTKPERLNASTTFKISKETFEFFKLKTREFRGELLELARLDQKADRVYQFTFNLFPVGRCYEK